jgi:hypothetical protein
MTVRLFDGADLLGTLDNYQDGIAVWKSNDSGLRAVYHALVVDFRTIANGTIDGRVEFTVTRGAVSVDRLDLATAELMHGNDEIVIGPPAIIARDRELCR